MEAALWGFFGTTSAETTSTEIRIPHLWSGLLFMASEATESLIALAPAVCALRTAYHCIGKDAVLVYPNQPYKAYYSRSLSTLFLQDPHPKPPAFVKLPKNRVAIWKPAISEVSVCLSHHPTSCPRLFRHPQSIC